MAPMDDHRALSFTQPWAEVILHGGKLVENRQRWPACHYRGPILIHAAKDLARGALVGRARIVGVARKQADIPHDQLRWWQGGFALLLADVEPLERPIPWPGALGLFRVPAAELP